MKTAQVLMCLLCMVLLAGCTSPRRWYYGPGPTPVVANDMNQVRSDRLLIWKAEMRIQVWCLSNAVQDAVSMAERQGGFVERKSDSGETTAAMTLRVPFKTFNAAVGNLEALGTVMTRDVHGEDVTAEYIDVDARLHNKIVLRDRLKQLLAQAREIKDILAIETELNRLQGDIESMEGRIKTLKGEADFATITLNLERKPILGPFGYLFKGIWWCGEKLFVIRD